jgi:hypothetical protein
LKGALNWGWDMIFTRWKSLMWLFATPASCTPSNQRAAKKDFLILQFPFELITNMNEFNRMTYLFTGMKIIRANESKELAIKMKDILVHMKDVYYSEPAF